MQAAIHTGIKLIFKHIKAEWHAFLSLVDFSYCWQY